jgi:hypothetical protein
MSVIDLLAVVTDLGGSVTLEHGKLKARVPADRPDLLEILKANRDAVLEHLTTANTGTLERLPWQLESLIRAATSDTLLSGSIRLESGLIPDLSRHTLAWAAAYLTGGDREDCLGRLWTVWRYWQGQVTKGLN